MALGPVDLPENVKIIADRKVQDSRNAVVGANETGYHFLTGVNPGRDLLQNTSISVVLKAKFTRWERGLELCTWIEIGHIFKSGTRYSASMGADVLDENGRAVPIIMGCYGIGGRLSAVMEQHARLFVNKDSKREYRYAWGLTS